MTSSWGGGGQKGRLGEEIDPFWGRLAQRAAPMGGWP